jgi:hypothetical protein
MNTKGMTWQKCNYKKLHYSCKQQLITCSCKWQCFFSNDLGYLLYSCLKWAWIDFHVFYMLFIFFKYAWANDENEKTTWLCGCVVDESTINKWFNAKYEVWVKYENKFAYALVSYSSL